MPRDPDHAAAESPLAELADLILNVGRLVRARTPEGSEVVPLTETERQVMRIVDLYPGTAPSEIARRARLQRTNVSTALRTLESKGMVARVPSTGRGVAVRATELAAANLRGLRSAWARELTDVLGDDLDTVRQCTELLQRLEQRLTTDDGHLAGR
ncbi:MarR family transcriptional regulator [Actinoplanes sp. Pm04-4]|uniref:MarR family transcriptional regulator n=1 Tax=Paractinoplanes pyxinae TaxID=2997416 RepID=A0ABT4B369_9ACTN|nr:MarR family transcriptional regulator [Actinoplanes pyxinae]MCY1140053.1 MarR family transcriptional regulator [Actinoplanes pyxinae]